MSLNPDRRQRLTADEIAQLAAILRRSQSAAHAAREFGCNPRTAKRIAQAMREAGDIPFRYYNAVAAGSMPPDAVPVGPPVAAPAPDDEPVDPVAARNEERNAAFWRRRAKELEKSLADAEHLAEQLAGVRDVSIRPPEWMFDNDGGRKGKSVIGCLISDVHMGEVISPDETLGIGAFDVAIATKRLERYFQAACIVGQRWAADTECRGAVVALAGDMISGDIHEELRITNELTSQEQVRACVEAIIPGLKALRETYGRVHVIGVPGNHGRATLKPTAKLYARLSYDTLVVHMIHEALKNDDRFTWQYGQTDQVTTIFGRVLFTTHGDKIGTKGGMGFSGPMLPIVRGAKKIEAQQAQAGRRPDLIQFGHYHHSGNPGSVLSNGSVPGYSEYGQDLRATIEPPQQWLYLLHSKWWLRERASIQLEPPVTPELPRVRIPAVISEP